jgi:hypothetical protein
MLTVFAQGDTDVIYAEHGQGTKVHPTVVVGAQVEDLREDRLTNPQSPSNLAEPNQIVDPR